jgi:hypothetical protein
MWYLLLTHLLQITVYAGLYSKLHYIRNIYCTVYSTVQYSIALHCALSVQYRTRTVVVYGRLLLLLPVACRYNNAMRPGGGHFGHAAVV